MTPAERDECVRLWEAGFTLDRLSELFIRDRTTITRLIARRQLQRSLKIQHETSEEGLNE
jgi:hypothetical protein